MQKIMITGFYVADAVNMMLRDGWKVIMIEPNKETVFVVLEKDEENKNEIK